MCTNNVMHEHWEKRLRAVLKVLQSEEYIALKCCQVLDSNVSTVKMPEGPDHTDPDISKRSWENHVSAWKWKVRLSLYFHVWAANAPRRRMKPASTDSDHAVYSLFGGADVRLSMFGCSGSKP